MSVCVCRFMYERGCACVSVYVCMCVRACVCECVRASMRRIEQLCETRQESTYPDRLSNRIVRFFCLSALKCANSGVFNEDKKSCDCAQGWMGANCTRKYLKALF